MTQLAQNYPKSIKLLKVPDDIWCILLQEQAKYKKKRNKAMFGLEQTVYAIIRDHKRCEEK